MSISPFVPLISKCNTRLTKCCNERFSYNSFIYLLYIYTYIIKNLYTLYLIAILYYIYIHNQSSSIITINLTWSEVFNVPRPAESRGYLDRFSYIYLDGGLIPDQVFQLREKKTGLCLQLRFSMGCHQQHWGFMQETLANSGIYATAIGKKNDLCNINADGTNENGD